MQPPNLPLAQVPIPRLLTYMAELACTKLKFLGAFLKLEHGAPSLDPFSRLFRLLDPEQARACVQRFMASFAEACQGVVAIYGKVLAAHSTNPAASRHCICSRPGAARSGWCIGQIATDAKSNETMAVP